MLGFTHQVTVFNMRPSVDILGAAGIREYFCDSSNMKTFSGPMLEKTFSELFQ